MTKRVQQELGEERVTAKSRPMMNLTARMPSIVSSLTSSSPGKTWYEYQDPGKSVVEDDRSGKLDRLSPTGYSKIGLWSSLGLLKSGKVRLRRTIDQGNLMKLLEMRCNKFALIMKNLFSTEMRIPQGTERRFTMDRGNLRQC